MNLTRKRYSTFYRILRCKNVDTLPPSIPAAALESWQHAHNSRNWYYAIGYHYTSAAERAAVASYSNRPQPLTRHPLPWEKPAMPQFVTTSLGQRTAHRNPARVDAFTRTACVRWHYADSPLKRWAWCSLPWGRPSGAWRLFTIAQFRPTPRDLNTVDHTGKTTLPAIRRPAGYGVCPVPLSLVKAVAR